MEENSQPLGRMLVPVGEPKTEKLQLRRRRKEGSGRGKLIVHLVILVVLLGIIGFGIYDFMHEGPRQRVEQKAQPADSLVNSADADAAAVP